MCGIFGVFSKKNKLQFEKSKLIEQLKILMNNRGPDHFGFYLSPDERVFFGHSRLSIQDLSEKSNQPFKCKDGSILVYNGEIYNVENLSNKFDVSFQGSDTKLFSEIISKKPNDINSLIEGMYSFIKYDPKKNLITFGRDSFGEKPLYIYEDNDLIFLVSEINFLRVARYFDNTLFMQIQERTLIKFLLYGHRQVYEDENGISFFKKVKSVIPGSLNIFNLYDKSLRIMTPKSIVNEFFLSKEKIDYSFVDLRDVMVEQIEKRCISDAPTGVSLSGGIDSNLVTSVLCRSDNPPIKAFTLDSPDERFSESELASQAANYYGIKHIKVDIENQDKSPLKNLIDLSRERKSPFLTLTSIISWYLARAASNHGIKVMYSGIGGDEFFSGYYDHFYYRQNNLNISQEELRSFKKFVLPTIRNKILKDEIAAKIDVNTYSHHYEDFSQRLSLLEENNFFEQPTIVVSPFKSQLRTRMFAEIKRESIPVILHEDDLNYMNCSVENRSPLLSRAILLESLKIPEDKFFFDGFQKYPLREISKCFLNDEIRLNRKKIGFNYSVWDFLRSDKATFDDLMNNQTILWTIINKRELFKMIQNKTISEKFLFTIISIQAFLLQANDF